MKTKYRMHAMDMFADAYAPAYQSASMTMPTTRVRILDTALLAVSFFLDGLQRITGLAVRVRKPRG